MIKWKLKSFSDGIALYLYQPEGEGSWGEMRFDRTARKAVITKPASNTTPRYDHQAIKKFENEFCEGDLPYEFTQAWG